MSDKKVLNELQRLLDGNKRYVDERLLHPNQDKASITRYKNAQAPFAIVVTCSDSRVPAEVVFDVGIGDIFVIRSAGHTLSKSNMGSIEYGVTSLGVKLVLILGHTNCGAVSAAVSTYKNSEFNNLSDNMKEIISHIQCSFDAHVFEKSNFDVIKSYVEYQLHTIRSDESFMKNLVDNNVVLKGGIYDISTGVVEIL